MNIHASKDKLILLFVLMFSMFVSNSYASIDVYEFEDESKRAEFVSLTKELRCPKCQNQDIADSNAPIAADMRKEVHRLLNEGYDHESIVNHMIDRFGDFVSYKPRVSLETLMLWYGPWLFIVIGLLVIGTMLKMNKSAKQSKPDKTIENNHVLHSEEVKKILAKYDHESDDKS